MTSFLPLYDLPAYLIRRTAQLMTATFESELGATGITPSQLPVLIAVKIQEGMQQRELASALNWDEATVGGMVSRLEAQGLIERRPTPKSTRGRAIFFTEAGIAFYERIEPHIAAIQTKLLVRLEPREQTQLLRLLSKVLNEPNSYFPGPKPRKKQAKAG